jgi:hypothetical protein
MIHVPRRVSHEVTSHDGMMKTTKKLTLLPDPNICFQSDTPKSSDSFGFGEKVLPKKKILPLDTAAKGNVQEIKCSLPHFFSNFSIFSVLIFEKRFLKLLFKFSSTISLPLSEKFGQTLRVKN